MSSPITSQELEMFENNFINVTIHFEGRDKVMEFPLTLDDKAIFSLLLHEMSEMDGQSMAGEGCLEEMYSLFSVCGSSSQYSSDGISRNALSVNDVRQVVLKDGMLLGARNGMSSQLADADLLSNGGMKLTVDVTPSCSILLNGGIDYDLSTALAELIDNSIAALNPIHSHHCVQNMITVDMFPSAWKDGATMEGPMLRVCDTGKGMNLHELRAWATLGDVPSSQGDIQSTRCHDGIMNGDKHLLGSLGRYGVGGKHAAFQLASSVTVSTRKKGAPFVFEATLDAELLSGDKNVSNNYRLARGGRYSKGNWKNKGRIGTSANQKRQHRWIAELRVRSMTQKEVAFTQKHESWTVLELRKLKSGLVGIVGGQPSKDGGRMGATQDQLKWGENASVRRSLSNLFYFYLFDDPLPLFKTEGCADGVSTKGARISTKRIVSEAVERNEREEHVEDAKIHLSNRMFKLSLLVDGSPLLPSNSDFAQMWQAAGSELKMDLRIQPEGGLPVFATLYLLYFPFIGEQETLPSFSRASSYNPTTVKKPSNKRGLPCDEDDGLDVGGRICNNLVHVFWMGRYLPRGLGGRDEALKWMKPRKDQATSTPVRAWRRVRGFLFLGPEFEADRTKQSLVSGAPCTRALLQQQDRALQDRYCSWVSSVHKELDEELWFDEPLPRESSVEGGNQVIEYKNLFVGGSKYCVADRVEIQPIRATSIPSSKASSSASSWPRQKVFGVIQAMYEIINTASREKIGMVDILPIGEGIALTDEPSTTSTSGPSTTESYLASNLIRKLDVAEWNRKQKTLLNSKPSKLDWVECKICGGVSSIRGSRPPLEPVSVGCRNIPHYRIAISILNADSKPLLKQTLGATITMLGKHLQSGYEWTAVLSMDNSGGELQKYGQYIFSLLPPNEAYAHLSAPVISRTPNTDRSHSQDIGAGYYIRSGIYEYRFRCVELPLPTKEFTVIVVPGIPHKLSLRNCEQQQREWSEESCLRKQRYQSIFNSSHPQQIPQNVEVDPLVERQPGLGLEKKYPIPATIDVPETLSFIAQDEFDNEVSWCVYDTMESMGGTCLARKSSPTYCLRLSIQLPIPSSHLKLQSKWFQKSTEKDSGEVDNSLLLNIKGLLKNKAPISSGGGIIGDIVQITINAELVLNKNHTTEFATIKHNSLGVWFQVSAGNPTSLKYLPDHDHPQPPTMVNNKSPLPPLRFILHDCCGNRILSPHVLETIEVTCRCETNEVSAPPCVTLYPGGNEKEEQGGIVNGTWGDLGAVLIPCKWGTVSISKSIVSRDPSTDPSTDALSTIIETSFIQRHDNETTLIVEKAWSHWLVVCASNEPFTIDIGKDVGVGTTDQQLLWLSESFHPRSVDAYHYERCFPTVDGKEVPLLSCHAGDTVQNLKVVVRTDIWKPPCSGYQLALIICPVGIVNEKEDIPQDHLMSVATLKSNVAALVSFSHWEVPLKAGIMQLAVKLLAPSEDKPHQQKEFAENSVEALRLVCNMEVLPSRPYKLRLQKLDASSSSSSSIDSQARSSKSIIPQLKCGERLVLVVNVEDEFRNPILRPQWCHFTKKDHTCVNTQQFKSWKLPANQHLESGEEVMDFTKIGPLLFLKSASDPPINTAINTATVGLGVRYGESKVITPASSAQPVVTSCVETAFGWELHNVCIGGMSDDGSLYKVIVRDSSNYLKASNILVCFRHGDTSRVEINNVVIWRDEQHEPTNSSNHDQTSAIQVSPNHYTGLISSIFNSSLVNGEPLPEVCVRAFDKWDNSVLFPNSAKSGRKKQESSLNENENVSLHASVGVIPSEKIQFRLVPSSAQNSNDDIYIVEPHKSKDAILLNGVSIMSMEKMPREATVSLNLSISGLPMAGEMVQKYESSKDAAADSSSKVAIICIIEEMNAKGSNKLMSERSLSDSCFSTLKVAIPLHVLPGTHATDILLEQDLQDNNHWTEVGTHTALNLKAGQMLPSFRFKINAENGCNLSNKHDLYNMRVEFAQASNQDSGEVQFPSKVLKLVPMTGRESSGENLHYIAVRDDTEEPLFHCGEFQLSCSILPRNLPTDNDSLHRSSVLDNQSIYSNIKLVVHHEIPKSIKLLSPAYLPGSTIALTSNQNLPGEIVFTVLDQYDNVCSTVQCQFVMKIASCGGEVDQQSSSVFIQHSQKGKRVFLLPNGTAEITSNAYRGQVKFHQVELLGLEMIGKLNYPTGKDHWWKPEKYVISIHAKLPNSKDNVEIDLSTRFEIDVRPDGISIEEASLLDKTKEVALKQSLLHEKETLLLKAKESHQNEFILRKEQLFGYDNELQTLRLWIDDSLFKLAVVLQYQEGTYIKIPRPLESLLAQNSILSMLEHRERVVERLRVVQSTEKSRRVPCFGNGVKMDTAVRNAVHKLKGSWQQQQPARMRDDQCPILGLLGECMFLPSHEKGLACALAAQIGQQRMQSLVLSHSRYADPVQQSCDQIAIKVELGLISLNALHSCSIDECPDLDLLRHYECSVPRKTGNNSGSADIGDIHQNQEMKRLVSALDVLLGTEKLLDIPLPDIGLCLKDVQRMFNWCGYAINMLQFPMTSGVYDLSDSLRRTLFFPIIGKTIVVETMKDACNIRKYMQEQGVNPPHICCRDGSRIDELGFQFPAPLSGLKTKGDVLCIGERPLCADKEFELLKQINSRLEVYDEKKALRKDFYTKYYLVAKHQANGRGDSTSAALEQIETLRSVVDNLNKEISDIRTTCGAVPPNQEVQLPLLSSPPRPFLCQANGHHIGEDKQANRDLDVLQAQMISQAVQLSQEQSSCGHSEDEVAFSNDIVHSHSGEDNHPIPMSPERRKAVQGETELSKPRSISDKKQEKQENPLKTRSLNVIKRVPFTSGGKKKKMKRFVSPLRMPSQLNIKMNTPPTELPLTFSGSDVSEKGRTKRSKA